MAAAADSEVIQGHLYSVDRLIVQVDSEALSAQLNTLVAARKLQCNVGCMTNLVALLDCGPEALPLE